MRRPGLVALAAAGPLCVGGLRYVLPYYDAAGGEASARAVAADLQAQGIVLWLGLAATLTLVPGLLALWTRMPTGRLRDAGFSLVLVGYLCLPGLLVLDQLLWVGADQSLPPGTAAQLLDTVHPSALLQVGIFVPTHVLGTVLIGVLALRRHLVPTPVAWALIVSQPLHLAAAVGGSRALDLAAWTLTAVGLGCLAARPPLPDGSPVGAPETSHVPVLA